MTAPDWAALVQQTRARIDQAEVAATAARSKPWLRMAAWARDVLDRHEAIFIGATRISWCRCSVGHAPCADVLSVLRAWVPDLLTAAGVEP